MYNKINTLGSLLLTSVSAFAQQAGQVQGSEQSPQQVVVNGSQTDIEASQDFVAGKVIIGRKQIEQSGLQNVTEILKRDPVITLGKDGRISLLGLPGYTQILLDGRAPMGKSPLELDLSQVDKIEIIKSTTAETGPFGIAGTINVISRKIERKIQQQLNLGVTETRGEYGANGTWRMNQFSPESPWSFSLSANARHNRSPGNGADEQQLLTSLGMQPQFQASRHTLRRDEFSTLTSELAYQFGAGNTLSFKPDYGQITLDQTKTEQRHWVNDRLQQAWQRSTSPLSGYNLPLSWTYDSGDFGQIDTSLRLSQMQNISDSLRIDQDSANPNGANYALRRQHYRDDQSNTIWSFNYSNSISDGHNIKSGLQWTHSRHETRRVYWLNDVVDTSLIWLGGQSQNVEKKYRIFVQDDWRVNKTLALNAGLSMEDQTLNMLEEGMRNQARFRVWSPSAHLSKKLAADQKRQFRLSLARSFRAPDSSQLMLQPAINPFAPCFTNTGCGNNTIDTADSAGNPGLQPERALALNLSYEHGLSRDSQISIDVYSRQIDRKIGSELLLMPVSWAPSPRYVQRPANLGDASIQGVSLNWRVAVTDIWSASPKLDLRGSVGWAHSVMSNLPAQDNHLEGQLPWRAKLGLSYVMANLPVKIDLDANWLPADWLRNNLTQRTYESRQRSLSANAIWTVNPRMRLVMNMDNLFAPEAYTIREYFTDSTTLQTRNKNSAYTRVGIRMELKL